jgi:CRP-like cAMP-binding protein
MPRRPSDGVRNRLLVGLPRQELERLKPNLRQVELPASRTLKAEASGAHVYFPQRGIVSFVHPMRDGTTVEIGMVGREGFFGMSAILGTDADFADKVVQVEGSALSIPKDKLRRALATSRALHSTMLRFAQALLIQISQTTACSLRHTVQERLARRLLMAGDRMDGNTVPSTHAFLSAMLGVRRAGVSVALEAFRTAGLLTYRSGRIQILDRKGLEAASCECYAQVRQAYRSLRF